MVKYPRCGNALAWEKCPRVDEIWRCSRCFRLLEVVSEAPLIFNSAREAEEPPSMSSVNGTEAQMR
jgi:hypothetical protein